MSATYTAYDTLGWDRHSVLLLAAPRKSGKTYLINKLLLRGYRTEIDVRNNITDIPLTQEEITDLQVRRENYLNLVVSKLVL